VSLTKPVCATGNINIVFDVHEIRFGNSTGVFGHERYGKEKRRRIVIRKKSSPLTQHDTKRSGMREKEVLKKHETEIRKEQQIVFAR
jgi:hypothetical protein